MVNLRETPPKIRRVGNGNNIRIVWTDYGLDRISIIETGEQEGLTLHVATALHALLGQHITQLQREQDSRVKHLRAG